MMRLTTALVACTVLALSSAAFGAPVTQFSGTTSQTTSTATFRITMNATSTQVNDLEFSATVLKGPPSCALNSQAGTTFNFSVGELPISNHLVVGTLSDIAGDRVVVNAHATRTSINGSFIVYAAGVAGARPCHSGAVRFVARTGNTPAGGTAYSGTIGPGYLITFDVAPHARTVDDLVVAYDETCNGAPSVIAPTFRFKTLAITSGEFSGSTTQSFGPSVVDIVRIRGTFSGRVAAGQVSDTSKVAGFATCTQTSQFVATAT